MYQIKDTRRKMEYRVKNPAQMTNAQCPNVPMSKEAPRLRRRLWRAGSHPAGRRQIGGVGRQKGDRKGDQNRQKAAHQSPFEALCRLLTAFRRGGMTNDQTYQ